MKECFGLELANRFFAGACGVAAKDPVQRRQQREECHACPDFEHCCMVMNLVCNLRLAEEAKRGAGKRGGRLG